jgi:alkylation response protein AidB-like acyl-CoA dehydrogenase
VDLSLTAEQEQLLGVAKEFARSQVLPKLHGGVFEAGSPQPFEVWRQMGDLGWFSLAVPESRGGLASEPMDTAMLLQGLGAGPVPGPVFEDIVLLPAVLGALGWPVGADLTDALMAGHLRVAVGLPACGRGPATATTSTLTSSDGQLTGEVYPVREVTDATHFLLLSRRAGTAGEHELILLPSGADGVTLEPLAGFVPGQGRLVLDGVDTSAAAAAITLSQADLARLGEAVLAAVPALCAFQLGSCESVLMMSVGYSQQRVQFGRPIGSFQRVQDHVIELLNGVDSARWTTYFALAGLQADGADRSAIHVAKAATSVAHFRGCDSAHEVHAGIGTDVDYGLAPHTFISRCLYPYLGSPSWHRKRLIHELGLARASGAAA